jgi:upstream activation factor subunit UAF30
MATATPVTLEILAKELKALRKDVRKIRQHIEDPSGEKQAARAQNNGFNKPLDVTPELRSFLSLGPEDKISRSQVTRKVNEYVEAKGLKKGQHITLDETLQKLLHPPEGTQVTFLNIQKYINPHYIKPVVEKKEKPAADPNAPPKEKKLRPKVAKTAAA